MARNWKDIAELLGIAAIVASLMFVGLELQQSQRIAYAEQEGAQISDFMAIDDLMSSNAGIILKANSKEELSEVEVARVTTLVGTLHRTYFFANQRAFYLEHPSIGVPVQSFALALYENPGLRAIWEERVETEIGYFVAMSDGATTGVREQYIGQVKEYLVALTQTEEANR